MSNRDNFLASYANKDSLDDVVQKSLVDNDRKTQNILIKRPDIESKHLQNLLDSSHHDIKASIALHKNLDETGINKALDNDDEKVRMFAASNYNSTPKNINKALGDKSDIVKIEAIGHPRANKENFINGSKSTNAKVKDYCNKQLNNTQPRE